MDLVDQVKQTFTIEEAGEILKGLSQLEVKEVKVKQVPFVDRSSQSIGSSSDYAVLDFAEIGGFKSPLQLRGRYPVPKSQDNLIRVVVKEINPSRSGAQ